MMELCLFRKRYPGKTLLLMDLDSWTLPHRKIANNGVICSPGSTKGPQICVWDDLSAV